MNAQVPSCEFANNLEINDLQNKNHTKIPDLH